MEYKKWFRKIHKGVETESTEMSYSTTHTKMVSSAPHKGFMWPDLVCHANRFFSLFLEKEIKIMTYCIQPQFLDLVPKFLPSFPFFLPFSIHFFFSCSYLLSLPHSHVFTLQYFFLYSSSHSSSLPSIFSVHYHE